MTDSFAWSAVTPPLAVDAQELYRFFHTGDDEVLALRGVSLHARAGEFVAVMGPSGSGKSTLLACMAGLDDPDGGVVRVGRADHEPAPRARAGRAAGPRGRGGAPVGQPGRAPDAWPPTCGWRSGWPAARAGRTSTALLERVGLAGRAGSYPAQLSGGEAVRAGLAVALVNRPAVVVADEPTAEVDRLTEGRLLDLLRAEVERGLALVVATHSPAVAAAADRVVTLADGRVAA